MGTKNIYERFIWFDDRVRQKKYPNTSSLAKQFEISVKTAQHEKERGDVPQGATDLF